MSGEEINDRFIAIVAKRSGGGILGLSRSFKIIDRDGSGQLDGPEFHLAMTRFGTKFTKEESQVLFDFYDSKGSGDGNLDFDEFLKGLRGKMNDARRELVEQAFAKMDADGSGALEVGDVVSKYNTKSHPKVIAGEWTHEDACQEFLNAFEGDSGDGDNQVSIKEFMDYHQGLSSSMDEDDAFGMLMASNWGIEFIPKKEIIAILEVIKSKAKTQGDNPKKVVEKAFKYFDNDGSGMIEIGEFTKAMAQYYSDLTEGQITTMWGMFDADNSGTITITEFTDLVFADGGPAI